MHLSEKENGAKKCEGKTGKNSAKSITCNSVQAYKATTIYTSNACKKQLPPKTTTTTTVSSNK